MAENINIKVLIDAAEAAKTVQETRKALKDLRSAALQVEEGSDAFRSVTAAAGQLQDKMGDLASTTKYLGDDMKNLKGITSIMTGIAGGFAAAQGAAALFGGENQMVEESLLKVQSAMGILQGIQAVGEVLQKESAATLFLQNAYRSLKVTLLGEEAAATVTNTAATELEAAATIEATVAQEGLNMSMKANPILMLIGVITAAVAVLYALGKSTSEATEEQKALNESMKETEKTARLEQATFEASIKAMKEMKVGSQERGIAIENINKQYGTTLENLQNEEAFLKLVNEQVKEYTTNAKNRLITKVNEGRAETLLSKASDLRYKNEEIRRGELIDTQKVYVAAVRSGNKDLADLQYKVLEGLHEEISTNEKVALGYEAKANKALDANAKIFVSTETTNKKEVVSNKNKDSKILTQREQFVAEYKDLDNQILENQKMISDYISKNWSASFEDQLATLNSNLEEQTRALKTEYKEALAVVESQFEEWRKSPAIAADIVAGKWDYAKQMAEFNKANTGFAERRILIENQTNQKLRLIELDHNRSIEALNKEHQEKIRRITKETAAAVLASPEYKRFLEYITLQNKQAQGKMQEQNDEEIERFNKALIEKTKVFEKHQKTIQDIAKKENVVALKNSQGFLEINATSAEKMSEDSKAIYYASIAQSQQFREELMDQSNKYMISGSTIQIQMMRIAKTADAVFETSGKKIATLSVEQRKSLGEMINLFPDLRNESEELYKALSRGGSDADKAMAKYLLTLSKLKDEQGRPIIGPPELKSIEAFGTAVDKVTGALDLNEAMQEKVGRQAGKTAAAMGEYDPFAGMETYKIESVFQQVFDLRRDVRKGEAGDNKLLVAVYRDKLKLLQDSEQSISAEITKANMESKTAGEARIEQQKIQVATEKKLMEDAEKKANPPGSAKKTEVDSTQYKIALAELDKLMAKQKEVEASQSTFKGFKIFPTKEELESGMMSLEQALNKYPDIGEKIVQKTGTRYEELTKISNEFYEKESFDLFMAYKKGQKITDENGNQRVMTEQDYNKMKSSLKVNHEENMLSIDVAYGKKGQDAIQASEDKKTNIVENSEDQRLANKQRAIDETLALENQLVQGTMELYSAYTDWKVSQIDLETEQRLSAIDKEQEAWEWSLKERSVQEIQEEQKRKDFQKRKDEEEKQREIRIREVKMEQFRRQKYIDVVQAGINGAVAITKAMAVVGPYSLLIQGLIAAQTAAQIGFISAQQPAFAEGGLVIGPGGPKDDKISARLSNGESVINASSTKRFAPLLSAINQAGGGKPIPSMSGGNMANGGGGMQTTYIGEKAMAVDNRDLIAAIENLSQRPVEAYVRESAITGAQSQARKEDRRSSY